MRHFRPIQSRYPSTLFNPLKHSLSRRSLDGNFLPSILPPSGSNHGDILQFYDLVEKVDNLRVAVLGTSIDRTVERKPRTAYEPHPFSPPLPSLLRERVVSALTEMETEAVELGKSIELNNFRSVRKDPRAQAEKDLAAWRSEAHARWDMLADELMAEVGAFWKIEKRRSGSKM